ncbi:MULTISPECIES: tripartite tricarboxylate transporter TctB family protein [Ancylobacter]|uniref:Membrane protein n=1 Tax=Ancylobacter defluvii TaxID=1282440 RepID=A0A9W6NAR9_9HYPH|nr:MULTISPECIES: tripartite tricarboxylate transporter TctB family protein [Ancylobacter]MBS7589177.1 tripartite tricarboxylate transporter TctB family protein [Ancylobacter defluvii]MDR6953086.1 putative phage tail protein [Ancylobacter sp. 3268]GLK84789.1 membrane protein [Ancylobacter defluvii]
MDIKLSSDFLTGLFFCSLGALAIIIGSDYPIGTAARMGAGYFPLMVSSGLILLGGILIIRSFLTETEEIGAIDVRPLLLLIGSILLFGLLIEDWGFPVAGLAVVIGARIAGRHYKPLETALLAVGLVGFCLVLFSYGLGLHLPATRLW